MNKKNRRNKKKYPALDTSTNLKSRRDYMDNRHYVNGVKESGKMVMPPLNDEQKKFLNDFNEAYYNASTKLKFGHTEFLDDKLDIDSVEDIKGQIKAIKKERGKIYKKSPESTTESDREFCRMITEQIEEMEDFLDSVQPKRTHNRMNYARNNDFLNKAKMSNEYDLVSWDEVNENELVEICEIEDAMNYKKGTKS